MPAERVTMRKIKDILGLKWALRGPVTDKSRAARGGVARSTVAETLYRGTVS